MQSQQKRPRPATRRRPRRASEVEKVQIAANSYCLRQYAVGYTGGTPRHLSLRGSDVWIVPVNLTSPGYATVGEVGVMAIDAVTQEVLDATPRDEVKAAGTRLAREKRDELVAAFHRARKP